MLVEVNERLVKVLAAAHPEFRDVGRHHGRMTIEAIKDLVVFSPALRVGPFGKIVPRLQPNGETELTVPFAAAVIASEGGNLDSQDKAIKLALDIAGTLNGFAPGQANEDSDWPAIPGVGLCHDVAIDIAAGEELEEAGIALWVCLFKVCFTVGPDRAYAEAASAVDLEFTPRVDPLEVDV
nr:hypothetical protein [uncultured Shinella sp.]